MSSMRRTPVARNLSPLKSPLGFLGQDFQEATPVHSKAQRIVNKTAEIKNILEQKDKLIKDLEYDKEQTQDHLIDFYFSLNPGIELTEKDRERIRLKKLQSYVIVDFLRALIGEIEKENEDFRKALNKKNLFFLINKSDDESQLKTVDQRSEEGVQKQYSSSIKVDKDEYFQQMKAKVDLLKGEKRRLQIESEKLVKENVEVRQQKNKVISQTKDIINEIKASNDNLVKLLEEKQEEADNLKREIVEKKNQIAKMKDKMIELQKLDQKVKLLEHKYVYDVSQIQNTYERHAKDLNTELDKKQKFVLLASNYEEKIQFLETELKAYKEKLKIYQSKELSINKIKEISDKRGKEVEKLSNDVTIMKVKLAEKEAKVEELKDQNLKFFDQLQEYKKNKGASLLSLKESVISNVARQHLFKSFSIQQYSSVVPLYTGKSSKNIDKSQVQKEVEQNPFLLKQYKKMVEEKDKIVHNFIKSQINEMTKRFKKLNLSEKAMYLKTKEFEHIKAEYNKLLLNQRQKVSISLMFQSTQAINLDESVTESSIDEREYKQQVSKRKITDKSENEESQLKQVKSMDRLYKEELKKQKEEKFPTFTISNQSKLKVNFKTDNDRI